MNQIEHNGQTYVLKSDMDAQKANMETAFKERISKLSSRALQAEEAAKQLQEQLDVSQGEMVKMESLNEQIQQLNEQLKKSESKYQRHLSISEMGIQDPEIIEMVEWAYNRATKDQEKAPELGDWLQEIKKDPTKAPKVLVPHLQLETATATEPAPGTEPAQTEPPVMLPPKTNTGTTTPPLGKSDIFSVGLSDMESYRAHRENMRKTLLSK